LKIAFGLAVPAMEAWYRCGLDSRVNERAWIDGLGGSGCHYATNSLKRAVYGTERPSLEMETARAVEEATRLTQDLARLEADFPRGFGLLAREARAWRIAPGEE
jgi:hypothetical protein